MNSMKWLRYGVLLALVLLLGVGRIGAAPQAQAVLDITSPGEGSVLSGQVTIVGTATHPQFASYGVLYATGANVTGDTGWRMDAPVAWNVTTMVVNGTLGVWDTTLVPNGQYVLALVVYEAGNETPNVRFVNNLTVNNVEPTPTEEPTQTPTPGAPEGQPTETPQPGQAGVVAPTIEQPPTATPRLTAPVSAQATRTGDEEEEGINPADILSGVALKEAFTTGVWLAVFLYVLGVLYAIIKALVRYYFRQLHRRRRA